MPTHFDLVITADYPNRTSEFFLHDSAGVQIAYRRTDFKTIASSRWQGLFDLRNYLRILVEAGKERTAMAEIGVCIAEEVLGREIFEKLWASKSQRTLRIQLPGASEEENHLAAALARVPWEIARPKTDGETLGERNLLVRIVHDMKAPASTPIELAADEALRVLFVFAEARGSRPLGARRERRALLRLFGKEIYPQRRIVAHFLTHGVTRERLESQIQENGGYHIVHWSGHGHMNLLELCKPGGTSHHISGQEVLALFNHAGGFLPRLFFLSACHSGDILRIKDWNDFVAVAQGKEPGTQDADTREIDIQQEPGYTGTAHALLQGGVPSVVAMRSAVGDDYAREAAVEFYRALLAHTLPKNVAASLTMARQAMLDGAKHDGARFDVCDHAMPVLYGEEQLGLTLAKGRSPDLNPRNPRLHQIAELTSAGHENFVGRTWELVGLGSGFIGSSTGSEVKTVAVITGLGGMGKTALTAEVLELWEARFEWVLLYQAKPNALGFEATLRDIHTKLNAELGRYHEHVKARPADAVYRDVTAEFTGPERLERLTLNLLRALKDEPILIVLDNFETNLKPQVEPATVSAKSLVWACQDPAWDHCLDSLATELVGSFSRVLITCRRPPAALSNGASHSVLLGPLPSSEAALFLREHSGLSRMVFGTDATEKSLALRLLTASRFHPLLMDRLARLATKPELRSQLLRALDTLEAAKNFAELPTLFATNPGDAKELAYLNDALATSLDQLIYNAVPAARRLLWIIAVANEPVTTGLLRDVWNGQSNQQQRLRKVKQMLDMLPQLSAEIQETLKAIPPELHDMLDALPPDGTEKPDLAPLLRHLVSVGLATEERTGPEDQDPDLSCHELTRERICAWMKQYSQDRADLTENSIRLVYAERLEAIFNNLQHHNTTAALGAGSRALAYYVQAGAYTELRGFASLLVTSTRSLRMLEQLIPHLQTAVEAAPEGALRWSCLGALADALRLGGQPDVSLQFYEQAAVQARVIAEANGADSMDAWTMLGVISGNWANALGDVGLLDAARQRQLESVEASKKVGKPAIHIIGSELEILRIDIVQGKVKTALPAVEARLAQVEAWWKQQRAGHSVPEAPDAEVLARVLIGALDIARSAQITREDWTSALRWADAILAVKRALERSAEDIAGDQMNRANILTRLGLFQDAKTELECCLLRFQNDPANSARVLGSLADLFANQGDIAQAITQQRRSLALREQCPDPGERAVAHHNLANYLARQGTLSTIVESNRHRLADLIYCLVAGLTQSLQTSVQNYAVYFRHSHVAGNTLAVPGISELLADPVFHSLENWLSQRKVGTDELQAAVDQLVEQARQAALETVTPKTST